MKYPASGHMKYSAKCQAKTPLKRWNLFLPSILILLSGLLTLLTACSSSQQAPDNVYRTNQDGRPLVDDKYSLQADRKALDELRAEIPGEVKRENDELALVLGMMSETKKSPSDIRSRFDSILRKKRSLFDKDITKERETFTKEERKKREEFLKSQRDQREVFGREKHSREERAEFFKELDHKRSEYFSVERDRRNDFESDVRERRKNFEDYVREKQNDFNQENRAYTKRYDEMKKQEREQERERAQEREKTSLGSERGITAPIGGMNSELQELEDGLEAAKSKPGTWLESGE